MARQPSQAREHSTHAQSWDWDFRSGETASNGSEVTDADYTSAGDEINSTPDGFAGNWKSSGDAIEDWARCEFKFIYIGSGSTSSNIIDSGTAFVETSNSTCELHRPR